MTIKSVNGKEITLLNDDAGNSVYYPNPAKDETKMSLWNDLFGEPVAKIMRANYLSHSKNGYKVDGVQTRNIRDLQGNILRTMELKEETEKTPRSSSSAVSAPSVSLSASIAVYNELVPIKGTEKARDLLMDNIKLLIPAQFLDMDVATLKFLLTLKENEAKAAAAAAAAAATVV
jgi:hypothetical protein